VYYHVGMAMTDVWGLLQAAWSTGSLDLMRYAQNSETPYIPCVVSNTLWLRRMKGHLRLVIPKSSHDLLIKAYTYTYRDPHAPITIRHLLYQTPCSPATVAELGKQRFSMFRRIYLVPVGMTS
jgi:hypothetical protein